MAQSICKVTDKQIRRLENLKAGLKRNNLRIKDLYNSLTNYFPEFTNDYSSVRYWINGKHLGNKADADAKIDWLERAYAKLIHLDISDKESDAFKSAVIVLDTDKLRATMNDLGLNINQVIFLSRCSDLTEDCLSEPTFSCSEETTHKLEELFYKPGGFFNYVEPEPEPSAVPIDLPESVNDSDIEKIKYDLIACREELERMKKDYSQLRENFFNFTMAFATLENSNTEIYKMVKELHFALTGSNDNTGSTER